MSHDAEHNRIQGALEQLARAIGRRWSPCPNQNCNRGVLSYSYHDDPCGTCKGTGQILTEERGLA